MSRDKKTWHTRGNNVQFAFTYERKTEQEIRSVRVMGRGVQERQREGCLLVKSITGHGIFEKTFFPTQQQTWENDDETHADKDTAFGQTK